MEGFVVFIGFIGFVVGVSFLTQKINRDIEMNKALKEITAKYNTKDVSKSTQKIISKVDKMDNQDDLFNMLLETTDSEIESRILKKISEEPILLKIVFSAKSDVLRYSAAKKLKQEESFVEIASSKEFEKLKLLAYEKIRDRSTFERIVQKETNSKVLLEIIVKKGAVNIVPEKILLKLISQTKDIMLIKQLTSGLKRDESFLRVAKSIKYKEVKFKAIDNISDEDMLMELVKSDNGKEIKLAALNKIKNEDRLIEISKLALNKEVKLLAYQNISNEEKLKELILAEVDVDFLMSYFQVNQDKIELIKNISISDASLPIKLMQFEKDFMNTIENTNILESLFTKEGLNIYAQLVSAKKENMTIKDEIMKRDELIKLQCNKIIENKEDVTYASNPESFKPNSLIEMINTFNSYKDLFSTFSTANQMVQFLHLYDKYSGIYNLKTFFYSERTKYLDDYDASNNLTDMGRYYDVELRHENKGLDFESAIYIYDMLRETSNQKEWWIEAITKAWLDSFSIFLVNGKQYYIPSFMKDLTTQLILSNPKSLIKKVLTGFINTDFEFFKPEKPEYYVTDGFNEFIANIKEKLK